MPSTIHFRDVRERFTIDDSILRDIYALQTSKDVWRRFLSQLMAADWPVDLRINETPSTDIDRAVQSILDPETRKVLSITLGTARLHCHFFCEGEIELDLDVGEISEETFPEVLRFVKFLAEAAQRNVFVTEEGGAPYGIFAFRLETKTFELLRRPATTTALGADLARRLGPILAPFNKPASKSDPSPVPTNDQAAEAAAAWRALYTPDLFEWHTELTEREYRTLDELDTAFHIFFGDWTPDERCRIGGFEMKALKRQFWDAVQSARTISAVFGTNDLFQLSKAMPHDGSVPLGEVGVVLMVYGGEPCEYEVKFVDDNGGILGSTPTHTIGEDIMAPVTYVD